MGRVKIHESKQVAKQAFDTANKERWLKDDPYKDPTPKRCTRCNFFKSRQEFARSRCDIEGLQAWCRSCCAERHRVNPIRAMLTSAKTRAKSRGFLFDLTPDQIKIPAICPVLGIPIRVGSGKGRLHNSPSLDRIDNTKGYTQENVRVISHRANTLKSDATLQELELIAADARRIQCESK